MQRSVCLYVRQQTNEDSSAASFLAGLREPQNAENVRQFRLFSSQVAFCLLAMMDLEFLQPNMSYAKRVFDLADRMLQEEYGLPKPEPRRLVKRMNDLRKLCVMEAVARVFFYKQTAVQYEGGMPLRVPEDAADPSGPSYNAGQPYDVTQLYDAIRTAHPTFETIIGAWTDSLEYSIGTSSHGTNVMTAICEKIGFSVQLLLRKLPEESVVDLAGHPGSSAVHSEIEQLMKTVEAAGGQPLGAMASDIDKERRHMHRVRLLRNELRRKAIGSCNRQMMPLDAITAVCGVDSSPKFVDAMLPSANEVAAFHSIQHLAQWCLGNYTPPGSGIPKAGSSVLHYREDVRSSDGTSKVHDFANLLLQPPDANKTENAKDGQTVWSAHAAILETTHACMRFGMHREGIKDALIVLSTGENTRPCPQMPELPSQYSAEQAFEGRDNSRSSIMSDKGVRVAPIPGVDVMDSRNDSNRLRTSRTHRQRCPIQGSIDAFNRFGRLPALSPLTSTEVVSAAPIRQRPNGTLEVNMVVAFDHALMLAENILRLSDVPGVSGRHERLLDGNTMLPHGLGKSPDDTESVGHQVEGCVATLPFAYDLNQMRWGVEVASMVFDSDRDSPDYLSELNNERARRGHPNLEVDDLEEITLRYQGLPKTTKGNGREDPVTSLSVKTASGRTPGVEYARIEDDDEKEAVSDEDLRFQAMMATGRNHVTSADVEARLRALTGDRYVHGIEGFLLDKQTWRQHALYALYDEGKVLWQGDGGLDCLLNELVPRMNEVMLSGELEMKVLPVCNTYSARLKREADRARRQRRHGTQLQTTGSKRPRTGDYYPRAAQSVRGAYTHISLALATPAQMAVLRTNGRFQD